MHVLKHNIQHKTEVTFDPLPDDKTLDWSKFKQIADENLKWI